MALQLVKMFGEVEVRARECDRYVNATALAKAAGKLWGHYRENRGTDDFLAALSRSIGIPIDLLVQVKMDGPNESRGTWVHPRVVIHFAQWASADFAAAVTGWTLELITTGRVELDPSTGDSLLDSIRSIQRATAAIAETRLRQLELERVQAETHALAERSERLAVAALDQARNNHGKMQVLGYARTIGLELSEAEAARHGRRLSRICRERGVEVTKQHHQRYGFVNLYPMSVLEWYFGLPDCGAVDMIG